MRRRRGAEGAHGRPRGPGVPVRRALPRRRGTPRGTDLLGRARGTGSGLADDARPPCRRGASAAGLRAARPRPAAAQRPRPSAAPLPGARRRSPCAVSAAANSRLRLAWSPPPAPHTIGRRGGGELGRRDRSEERRRRRRRPGRLRAPRRRRARRTRLGPQSRRPDGVGDRPANAPRCAHGRPQQHAHGSMGERQDRLGRRSRRRAKARPGPHRRDDDQALEAVAVDQLRSVRDRRGRDGVGFGASPLRRDRRRNRRDSATGHAAVR